MKMTFIQKQNYGKDYYYPQDANALIICELTKGKSLSARQLDALRRLGAELVILPASASAQPTEEK